MRSTLFLSAAYLAGVHGFALFVPYLALTMGVFHLAWAARRAASRRQARQNDVARLARRLRPDRHADSATDTSDRPASIFAVA